MKVSNRFKQTIKVYKNTSMIDDEGYSVSPTLGTPTTVQVAVETLEDRLEDAEQGLKIKQSTIIWYDGEGDPIDKNDILLVNDKLLIVTSKLLSPMSVGITRYEVKEYDNA